MAGNQLYAHAIMRRFNTIRTTHDLIRRYMNQSLARKGSPNTVKKKYPTQGCGSNSCDTRRVLKNMYFTLLQTSIRGVLCWCGAVGCFKWFLDTGCDSEAIRVTVVTLYGHIVRQIYSYGLFLIQLFRMTGVWGPRNPLDRATTLRIQTRNRRHTRNRHWTDLTGKDSFVGLRKLTFTLGVRNGLHA